MAVSVRFAPRVATKSTPPPPMLEELLVMVEFVIVGAESRHFMAPPYWAVLPLKKQLLMVGYESLPQ